jgi:hypothetical protein
MTAVLVSFCCNDDRGNFDDVVREIHIGEDVHIVCGERLRRPRRARLRPDGHVPHDRRHADELHAMADRIGVARRWFQAPPKASFWHYDIAKSKRALAVAAGAIDCDRNTFVAALRRIRESGVFGDWKTAMRGAP